MSSFHACPRFADISSQRRRILVAALIVFYLMVGGSTRFLHPVYHGIITESQTAIVDMNKHLSTERRIGYRNDAKIRVGPPVPVPIFIGMQNIDFDHRRKIISKKKRKS